MDATHSFGDRADVPPVARPFATPARIEEVYRDGYARFVRVALAITGSPDVAADAVHDAFVDALRTRDAYRGDAAGVEGWLWRAVVNRARNRRRWSRLRRARTEPLSDHEAPAGPDGPDPHVRSLIARLPERQRTALFLRYYADLDYEGIAAAMGITSGAVGNALHTAHASLRRALEEEDR